MHNNKNRKNNRINKQQKSNNKSEKKQVVFPAKFPFWARYKVSKNRTTLVIDEEIVTKNNKSEDCFVHREATHTFKKDYEKVKPNPDKDDERAMYLKRPAKKPKKVFAPHNKNLAMPQKFIDKYDKNNKKT